MMQFEYMQVAHPYGILQAHDLNAYGSQGWMLQGIDTETSMSQPTGIKVYTFMRALPTIPPPPPLGSLQRIEPHQHEARASRKEPVVESDETTDQEGQ
jgi:hypothetical protein